MHSKDGNDLRPMLFEMIKQKGWSLRELTQDQPSLEDLCPTHPCRPSHPRRTLLNHARLSHIVQARGGPVPFHTQWLCDLEHGALPHRHEPVNRDSPPTMAEPWMPRSPRPSYSTPFFWFIVLLACPAITMRSFAHEKSTGTYESLMTTPVTPLQVLGSKFMSCWLFYGLLWVPLWLMMIWLGRFFNDPGYLDAGIVAGTSLGVMLVGALFLSIGCLASVLTQSQLIAAMMALTLRWLCSC